MIIGALFGLGGIHLLKPFREHLSWLVPTHIALYVMVQMDYSYRLENPTGSRIQLAGTDQTMLHDDDIWRIVDLGEASGERL